MTRRSWGSLVLTLPVFAIAMAEMWTANPLARSVCRRRHRLGGTARTPAARWRHTREVFAAPGDPT